MARRLVRILFAAAGRVAAIPVYRRGMAEQRVDGPGHAAEPLLRDRNRYRAKYVAVRDGEVLLEATTHAELVAKVRARNLQPGSFVARYVDVPPYDVVVGVG